MSTPANPVAPWPAFRFELEFTEQPLQKSAGATVEMCKGAFADCTGLEATMEPKVIKEGGRNYGAAQRAGQVTFATVILKRGMTPARDLWKWFSLVNLKGGYAYRLNAKISMKDAAGNVVLSWQLLQAMPIKFKSADLSAKSTEIGIEELHIAHEGLSVLPATDN